MKRTFERQLAETITTVAETNQSTRSYSPSQNSSPSKKTKVSPTRISPATMVIIDLTQSDDDESEYNHQEDTLMGHDCKRCSNIWVEAKNMRSCDSCCKTICDECYDEDLEMCTKCRGPEKDENGCNRFGKCGVCSCKCARNGFMRCEECDVRTCGDDSCYNMKNNRCPKCDSTKQGRPVFLSPYFKYLK